jgi:hypothetical protein
MAPPGAMPGATPDAAPHAAPEAVIRRLADDLRPVRRLRPPLARALLWLLAPLALGLGTMATANVHALMLRMDGAPDLWVALLGSAATAILAGIAAFELSLPDRQGAWALLPLPALAVWLGASGMGCLRDWIAPGTQIADLQDSRHCLLSIIAYSVPLSLLLVAMLRRARPLRPGLVAPMGGLAIAAAAATLLALTHPYDSAATDLLVHLLAVLLVVLANAGAARVIAA